MSDKNESDSEQRIKVAVIEERLENLTRRIKTLELLAYSALTGIAGVVGLAVIGLVIRTVVH